MKILLKFKAQLFIILFLSATICSAQNNSDKKYFDKAGKSSTPANSFYYRQKADKPGVYNSYYTNSGALFFEGSILTVNDQNENLNIYTGTCNWFFKNGKKKSTRTFDTRGIEQGTSFHYYETGKVWKEIEFKDGKLVNNTYKEYSEDGLVSKIFEEEFENNINDWDLFSSDKSYASIKDGWMEIGSNTNEGTSRYINISSEGNLFALETSINTANLNEGHKTGLLFGFKDWQNYNFYFITGKSFSIGTVFEGVTAYLAKDFLSPHIRKREINSLKIISGDEKVLFSLNGAVLFSSEKIRKPGNNIGIGVSSNSSVMVDKIIFKEMDFKPSESYSNSDIGIKSTGSGLIISSGGYVITNYHVTENANKIFVESNISGETKTYSAVLVQKDMDNDLAILKIQDENFRAPDKLKYAFKDAGGSDVGASVFTIGFPLALSGMGREAKFTDGKISSKTGFNNSINSFQTTIPVQPGNSGGPLFNEKGQLIGLINAKVQNADNVSYAIKLNYILTLIELLPSDSGFPQDQSLATLPLEEKIKILTKYVVLIKLK